MGCIRVHVPPRVACSQVTSERNCICYPCGGSEYPATQVTDPSATALATVPTFAHEPRMISSPLLSSPLHSPRMQIFKDPSKGETCEVRAAVCPRTYRQVHGPFLLGELHIKHRTVAQIASAGVVVPDWASAHDQLTNGMMPWQPFRRHTSGRQTTQRGHSPRARRASHFRMIWAKVRA